MRQRSIIVDPRFSLNILAFYKITAQADQDRIDRENEMKEEARKAQEEQAQRTEILQREAEAKRMEEIKRAEELKRKADADLQRALALEKELAAEQMAKAKKSQNAAENEGNLESKEMIEAALLGAEDEQQWPVDKKPKKEKVAAGKTPQKKSRVVAGYNVVVSFV